VLGQYLRRDYALGQMSRDMTLFVDDDGTGYLITSAEEKRDPAHPSIDP